MKRLVASVVVLVMLASHAGMAQAVEQGAAWQTLAARLAPGSDINVRLINGQRFRATLIGAHEDRVVLLPKTRKPVPVQSVEYAQIASMEPRRSGGMSSGKAAAIGAATGVGAFFATMLVIFAIYAD